MNLDIRHLIEIQEQMRNKIILKAPLDFSPKLVAGADVAYSKNDENLYGLIVVLKLPELSIIEKGMAVGKVNFPYIPGFLSFRELPVLLKAFKRIKYKPDVILVDGQGIAHPRRLGLATHLGLSLKMPTIGCAKSHLIGTYKSVPETPGKYSLLKDGKEIIGFVLRTRKGKKPIFISPGHLMDIQTAYKIIISCLKGYRLPEPIRMAHIEANHLRAKFFLNHDLA